MPLKSIDGKPVRHITWTLEIELDDESYESWDEVPDILRQVAEQLPDLPIDEDYWDRTGRRLGRANLHVPDES